MVLATPAATTTKRGIERKTQVFIDLFVQPSTARVGVPRSLFNDPPRGRQSAMGEWAWGHATACVQRGRKGDYCIRKRLDGALFYRKRWQTSQKSARAF